MLKRQDLYVSPLRQDEAVADFVIDAFSSSLQGPHSVEGFKQYASNPDRLGLIVEFKSSWDEKRPNFLPRIIISQGKHFSSSVQAPANCPAASTSAFGYTAHTNFYARRNGGVAIIYHSSAAVRLVEGDQ